MAPLDGLRHVQEQVRESGLEKQWNDSPTGISYDENMERSHPSYRPLRVTIMRGTWASHEEIGPSLDIPSGTLEWVYSFSKCLHTPQMVIDIRAGQSTCRNVVSAHLLNLVPRESGDSLRHIQALVRRQAPHHHIPEVHALACTARRAVLDTCTRFRGHCSRVGGEKEAS